MAKRVVYFNQKITIDDDDLTLKDFIVMADDIAKLIETEWPVDSVEVSIHPETM